MQICSKEKIIEDFKEIDCGLALNRAAYNFHDSFTNQRKTTIMSEYLNRFGGCLKTYKHYLTLKNKKILSRIANYTIYQYYKQSKYLYRGTQTEELDNMLKHSVMGVGGGDYNFVCLSLFLRVAIGFTRFNNNYDFKKCDRVVIQFHKNKIKKDIVFPGYDHDVFDDKNISNPNNFEWVNEAEFRIPKHIKYNNKIKQLIFIGILTDAQKQCYVKKYSEIAPVVFLRDCDFNLDDKENVLKNWTV